ncbi:MAG: putative DNA binding domain-containing protein, partial [Clostridia bacterium]|nr:putative DNA binding domain-containing protein [Clostridia bacterium]
MTEIELKELLSKVQLMKSETQTLEIKSAAGGCPKKLYDTLSAFSNQDDGGIILFGVDETNDFEECGVYDPQDLQKHVTEQCNQMEPPIRPIFTVAVKEAQSFVSVEIPGLDVTARPCFYAGKGRMKGSYVRVGDSDEPMTEYEVYSYEAFRKKYQDDVRICERATPESLEPVWLEEYLHKLKMGRPQCAQMERSRILELMSVTKNRVPTLSAVMLFGSYPQAYYPQLCITAIATQGVEVGDLAEDGSRFIDNQRIEGTLPQMLDGALAFVRKNIKSKTVIDRETGLRSDKPEYPIVAVREAILNALIHRDYSIHTEGMPIQIILFEDRLEIRNPGGLYGRLTLDQLGKAQPDTRNPVIAVAMELMNKTENRYSGIPTMYREMKAAGLPAPEFLSERGQFAVCFRKEFK